MNNAMLKIKKWLKKNESTLPIFILTILIFIIGIFVVGFIKSFTLAMVITLIYVIYEYGGTIMKRIKGEKKVKTEKTNYTKEKTPKKKIKKKKKIWNNIMLVGLIVIGAGLIAFTCFAAYIVMSAKFDPDNLYTNEKSTIYDSENNIIAELGTEKREKVDFDELPQVLIDAIVATEDANFFKHNGVDLGRFTVATAKQLLGKGGGGASTISMQVIKNQFTSKDQTLIRKFTDIYLAVFKLEKKYTKQEIFEFYVNIPYLGNGAYGVQQAAKAYFGKDVKDLSLPEAAMIAGMFQAPGSYDPTIYPENTKKRRDTVLYLMKKHGYITEDQRKAASNVEITSMLSPNKKTNINKYQGYIDVVVSEVEEKTGKSPYNVSMQIYTALKDSKQQYIEKVLAGEVYTFKDDVVQTGIAVTDVNTGAIVAIGGGRNKTGAKTYNFATMIKRQIGSTAKPIFDYGPGIEYEDWNPLKVFVDGPHTYSDGKPISNADNSYMGSITMRTALTNSRNIPALKAFQSLNKKKILEFAEGLGMTPEVSNGTIHEAHAVGAFNGTSPLQMAVAYAAFSNGGYYIKPYTVNKIIYNQDGSDEVFSPTKTRAMQDSTAWMITDMLRSGIDNGSIDLNKIDGVQYAAKTGTSNFDDATKRANGLSSNAINDLWVVGFDQEYSIGMWYGYEEINKNNYFTTANWKDRRLIWDAIARGIFEKNGKTFQAPDSVTQVTVVRGSDPLKLANEYTPDDMKITEWFKKGTEPTETASEYQKIPDVSGLTAKEDNGIVTLSWNAPYLPETNGIPTYHIYLDGSEVATTDALSYRTAVDDGKKYTFTIKVSYSNLGNALSDGSNAIIDLSSIEQNQEQEITFQLKGSKNVELQVGEKYVEEGIIVKEGTNDVTSKSSYSPIGNYGPYTEPGRYTINYSVSYKNKTATLTRHINVTGSSTTDTNP